MEFRSHASGSGGNFYTVHDGGATLEIECGVSYRSVQVATQFQVTKLDGVLVSHAHGDHSRCARDLMKAGVDCFASAETFQSLKLDGHRAKVMEPHVQTQILSWHCGAWEVLPFPVIHDAPGCFGFMVQSPESKKTLVYLTDSAYSPFKFDAVHILAIECNYSSELIRASSAAGVVGRDRFSRTVGTHMSLETLLGMLKANDLSHLEEIHLLHLSNDNSDEKEFRLAVQRATGIPVFVAKENSIR